MDKEFINNPVAAYENLMDDYAELKAENERLKEKIKELAHYLACMTEQRNKANTILQEIKAIAENIKGTNTALYMNNSIIDATARQSIELQARFISTLITKAEEE